MPQHKTDADIIISKMMPSPWATYKQSLKSSVIGFVRVMFSYKGIEADGSKSERIGIVPVILIESVSAVVSVLKIILSIIVGSASIAMFLVSPVINLVMLPFYRRKSVRELRAFIDQQTAEIESQRELVRETLTGAL